MIIEDDVERTGAESVPLESIFATIILPLLLDPTIPRQPAGSQTHGAYGAPAVPSALLGVLLLARWTSDMEVSRPEGRAGILAAAAGRWYLAPPLVIGFS